MANMPEDMSQSAPAEQAPESEVETQPEVEAELAPVAGDVANELEELRANEVAFSWQASEYVHHHKGPGWYAVLLGIVAVLVAAAVLLHYWVEIVAFLAMGGAILVYARKPPRTLMYELTPSGITIEGKSYLFKEFRSFGVLPDTEWHTIDLEPARRLSPRLTLLFDNDDFDSIVGHLGLHLPRVDRKPGAVEWVSRFVRF
jgi:hypothetical protein